MQPVIGIISAKHPYSQLIPPFGTGSHYLEQVAKAGALPLQIPILPHMSGEDMDRILACCDGILLPGGADFDPEWYGESLLPGLEPDPGRIERDVQETSLEFIRRAAASGKPILGICLGLQVLMVALGGSLIQDIGLQTESRVRHRGPMDTLEQRWACSHSAELAEGSLIRRLSGSGKIMVNSFHHQAVKCTAPGFRVTAWAEDGIIEAVENEAGSILAVQWHPENLSHAGIPEAEAIFRWLAEAAGNR